MHQPGCRKNFTGSSVAATEVCLRMMPQYVIRTLPQGIIRGLTDALFHHDFAGLARATAIVVGLAMTTAGYLVGSIFLQIAKAKNFIFRKNTLRRNPETPLPLKAES